MEMFSGRGRVFLVLNIFVRDRLRKHKGYVSPGFMAPIED